MTDKAIIYKSITKIAYGYILILVGVMIGTIDILPDFIGYIMMLYAIDALKDESKTIALLKPFGIALAIWKFIFFALKAFGIESVTVSAFYPAAAMLYIIYIADILVSIISIYFDYQLLTEMSFLAKKYQGESSNLDKTILMRRNINTVCMTSAFLISNISNVFQDIPEDIRMILVIIPFMLSLLVMFLAVSALFSLSKIIKSSPSEASENISDSPSAPPSDYRDESSTF